MNLKDKLIKENKTKWLDIGCNKNFEKNFYYMDIFSKKGIKQEYRPKYFKANILKTKLKHLKLIGEFDMIRMQHVLEHFGYEDGLIILKNISKILKPDGILVITVPDLKININKYINNNYSKWRAYRGWAQKRIPKNAPASFYFSVYTHCLLVTEHKWCYDYVGLKYLLKLSNCYKNIKELKFTNKLSSYPFTHNRPEEDVCVIAVNKKIYE